MGHLWVSNLGGGVTLGAFVLSHVPWCGSGKEQHADYNDTVDVGDTVGVKDTARRSGVRGHCHEGGDTARVGGTGSRSLR